MPEMLDRLDVASALVTIDAIACNPAIAATITARGGDSLLAVRPTSHAAARDRGLAFFDDPACPAETIVDVDKSLPPT